MVFYQLLILICMEGILLNSSAAHIKTENEACNTHTKGDVEAENFDNVDGVMANYYAPYTVRSYDDVELESAGDRIQSIISGSITTNENTSLRPETLSEKTVESKAVEKIGLEDKLIILKALLLTEKSTTEVETKKPESSTARSLVTTGANFDTTINTISYENILKMQLKIDASTEAVKFNDLMKPLKVINSTELVNSNNSTDLANSNNSTKPGKDNNTTKVGKGEDLNDIYKPAIIALLATKCEQIQDKVNNIEEQQRSLKSTNENFSKEIRNLESKLIEIEHRHISDQIHSPRSKLDLQLDEILKKLDAIVHFQLLLDRKIPSDSGDITFAPTKKTNNQNVLWEHYKDALLRTKDRKDPASIAQQYKDNLDILKKQTGLGIIIPTSPEIQSYSTTARQEILTGRIYHISAFQDKVENPDFRTNIDKLLSQITKVNQGDQAYQEVTENSRIV